MSKFRKDFTQAKLNLASWKFVVVEIVIVSVSVASYLSNIYIFIALIFILLALFYFRLTAVLVSSFFALIWALMPSMITSIFTNVDFITSIPSLLSSASSQVLAFILFWVAFYYHITCADFLQDALEPLVKNFRWKSRKSHTPGNKKIKETHKKILSKDNGDIAFIKEGKVDPHELKIFLEINGFGLYQSFKDRNSEKDIILNDNGIIKFFNIVETKRWITNFIKTKSTQPSTNLGIWVKFTDIHLKKSVIDHLKVYSSYGFENTTVLNEIKDNENEAYIKFKNCVVKITKNQKEIISYDNLNGAIWESSIIPKNFEGSLEVNDDKCVNKNNFFEKFVEKSVLYRNHKSDSENWRDEYIPNELTNNTLSSLRRALGYLIHTYNDPLCTKAVFFVDKFSTQGKPEGGTGKSLIVSSINYLIKQSFQDGKKYRDNPNLGGRFQFSNVDKDVKNIFFDDLRQDFNIESIFTMVTGDLEVERKNKDKIIIPKNDRPKIALTTNYEIVNKGTSYKRRIHQIALGDYWNRCINEGSNPRDEIGIELFGPEYTQDDWDDFYLFAFNCVQDYLIFGLK